MSETSGNPWSSNPSAPQISYELYVAEKTNFAGFLVGAILYGIVVILFFQCMAGVLGPLNRTSNRKRLGLAAFVMAMFSFVTIFSALNLDLQTISYVDNREFPGINGTFPVGPLGYQLSINSEIINVVPNVMFVLNSWLTNGLLLYGCCVTYATKYRVLAFSFLLYFASFGMGIAYVHQVSMQINSNSNFNLASPYHLISLILNLFLTVTIVMRVLLLCRKSRKVAGNTARTTGLYGSAVAVLVESSFLYNITYLLFLGSWTSQDSFTNLFFPILSEIQAIAPFMMILRLVNMGALKGDTVVFWDVLSIRSGSPAGSTSRIKPPSNRTPTNPTDAHEESHGTPRNDVLAVTVVDRV